MAKNEQNNKTSNGNVRLTNVKLEADGVTLSWHTSSQRFECSEETWLHLQIFPSNCSSFIPDFLHQVTVPLLEKYDVVLLSRRKPTAQLWILRPLVGQAKTFNISWKHWCFATSSDMTSFGLKCLMWWAPYWLNSYCITTLVRTLAAYIYHLTPNLNPNPQHEIMSIWQKICVSSLGNW